MWLVLRSTPLGLPLRVSAATPRRPAGPACAVGGLPLAAMAVGGRSPASAAMIEVAGAEGRLRPGILAGFGYIGFLASWLARHHPLQGHRRGARSLLAAIAVGGNSLQIASGLSGGRRQRPHGAACCCAVLGWGRPAGRRA